MQQRLPVHHELPPQVLRHALERRRQLLQLQLQGRAQQSARQTRIVTPGGREDARGALCLQMLTPCQH